MKPNASGYQPMYRRTRGGIVESVHYGAVAVVNPKGELIAHYGDPQTVTFLRSSAKPFQALPLVEKGGRERFSITEEELALICASHSSSPTHREVLKGLQEKIGVSETDLACGTHLPFHQPTREKLICSDQAPSPNHHNCSGKHTGMLALAKLIRAPLENYPEKDHPVQQYILETFVEMCSLPETEINLGRDGCSVTTFALPLQHAAWAWARLADPHLLAPSRRAACQSISQAMTTHPLMIAGEDRFDTQLMKAAQGRIISKAGAEAYQTLGIPPRGTSSSNGGLGIAFKIADGDRGKSARSAVALEILRQLDLISPDELDQLKGFGPINKITNQREIEVGHGEPCFQLSITKMT